MSDDSDVREARPPRLASRKPMLPAVLLTLLFPGLGHWRRGNRRHALLFASLPLALAVGTLPTLAAGGTTRLLIILVTPGALLLLGALNLLIAGWRLSALAHLTRGLRLPPELDFAALFHGVDERVPVDALRFGARVLEYFLKNC